jgi:nicotinate-nucleotide--dimethylbenzimidazole phosphoribosyltransferase
VTASALTALLGRIQPVDAAAHADALTRWDGLVKPPGSLGALEALGARLAAIAGASVPPVPRAPAVVVAAGDHGVHAQGVTAWPQAITATMVGVIATGGAAVNQLAEVVGAHVTVLDVGVAGNPIEHPAVRRGRVREGTADLAHEPARAPAEAEAAIHAGATLAADLVTAGHDLLVPGDMGIANTTAAACLIAACTGADADAVTGRGAGADDEVLSRKRAVVADALRRHGAAAEDPLGALAALGGLEHAALVGVVLAGAAARVPVVLDGVSSLAAALVAAAPAPEVTGYLVAGHRSVEPGAGVALDHLGLEPVLDLGLRLGEGTGGLLAVPIVRAAAAALAGMARLDDLGA